MNTHAHELVEGNGDFADDLRRAVVWIIKFVVAAAAADLFIIKRVYYSVAVQRSMRKRVLNIEK